MKKIMMMMLALRGTEPIRLVVWPVLVVVSGYAVYRGIVDQSMATGLMALVAVVLGVPAVEAARSSVTPVGKVSDIVNTATDLATAEARELAKDRFGQQGTDIVDALAEQIRARARAAGLR